MASLQKRTWTNKAGDEMVAWRVVYTDQSGRTRTKQFKKQSEAKAFRNTVTSAVQAGTHVHDRDTITIGEAASTWLTATKNGRDGRAPVEEHTYDGYNSLVENHIRPRIGGTKLSRFRRVNAAAFRDELLADGISRSLTRKVLVALGSIFEEALSREQVASNPIRGVKVATRTRDEDEDEEHVSIPEPERIRELMARARLWSSAPPGIVVRGKITATPRFDKKRGRMFYVLLRVSVATGMRVSEVLGLPRKNVDLTAGTITITQRLSRLGKIGKPKSKAGYRTLEIPADLVRDLREWILERPIGDPDKRPPDHLDLVFPNGSGRPEVYNNLRSRFWLPLLMSIGAARKVVSTPGKKESIESDFTLHDLRHFHASQYIATGADPLDVKTRMGHSTIQVTYDIYGHLFQNEEARARRRRQVEQMESELFGGTSPRGD
jgi:integrase